MQIYSKCFFNFFFLHIFTYFATLSEGAFIDVHAWELCWLYVIKELFFINEIKL